MKRLSIILLLLWSLSLVATGSIFGQDYHNSPGDTIEQNTTLGAHAIVMNIIQTHTASDTLHFHWHKLSVSMPSGWTASICDNGFCYDSLADQGMMTPIVPGDDGLMSIHCQADSDPGTGIIRYTLYEEKNASKVDTLTWIVNAVSTDVDEIPGLKPHMSCAKGVLSLRGISIYYVVLDVYDITGRLLLHHDLHAPDERFALPAAISHGSYLVRLDGPEGGYTQKVINQ